MTLTKEQLKLCQLQNSSSSYVSHKTVKVMPLTKQFMLTVTKQQFNLCQSQNSNSSCQSQNS